MELTRWVVVLAADQAFQIDMRIMTWCWMMFVALELNRRNINRAISDSLLPELGMNTNDFNVRLKYFPLMASI